MGYERTLRLTIFYYHKTSADEARRYLEQMMRKHNFKNAARVSEIEASLESYIDWTKSERLKVADTQVKITFALGFLELRGLVSRVDVTAIGYRAVFLGPAPPNWQLQLRMPLIQAAISKMYSRPTEKVAVGFQEADGSSLQTLVYESKQIHAAERRFRVLGEVLRRASKGTKQIP
jgi:hypothetical protein